MLYYGAGAPGGVDLSYGRFSDSEGDETLIQAAFKGEKYLSSLTGGSFSLSSTVALTIKNGLLDILDEQGFDYLSLDSDIGIAFSDTISIDMDRAITLDAPAITSDGANEVTLNAP